MHVGGRNKWLNAVLWHWGQILVVQRRLTINAGAQDLVGGRGRVRSDGYGYRRRCGICWVSARRKRLSRSSNSLASVHHTPIRLLLQLLVVDPRLLDRDLQSGGVPVVTHLYASLVFLLIVLEQSGCFDIRRAARVGIIEQTLYGGEDSRYIIRWRPPILKNVETEFTIIVDVWVEHAGDEPHCGRFVRVRIGESEGKAERPVLEWCLG